MNYEKKYKEALERAKQFSEKPYLEDSAGIVEYIFPELKESEDEEYIDDLIGIFDGQQPQAHSDEEVINWLKTLKEQIRMKNMILNLSNHQVQDILEELGMIDDCGNCPYTAEEIFKSALEYSALYYVKTNKQEWSEEDEKMFEYALNMIEWYSGKNEDRSRLVSDWLKSLKKCLQK